MPRFELEIEYDYDFDLIGIACHLPDYRMCWTLNRALEIDFERMEKEITSSQKVKSPKASFPLFYFRNADLRHEFTLIVNKYDNKLLMSEVAYADYLLMVKGVSAGELKNIVSIVRSLNQVQTASTIVINSLKHKETLIF